MKCLLFVCLVFCIPLAQANTDDQVMTYRYWDQGVVIQRNNYQIAALTLALDKTIRTHGEYQIIRKIAVLSRTRAYREIARGEIMNVHASPAYPVVPEKDGYTPAASILVNVPLLQSLLGYRSLIIRRSDYEKFSKIKTANELKLLTAGQGRHWADTQVYRHNGYKVMDDAEYPTLFSMLIAGRFDYIPLGAIEVEDALKHSSQVDNLMILPDLILYYPLPTIFHVSAKHPELAARLEAGLTLAKKDGSLDKLFNQHFSDDVQRLRSPTTRVFVLQNPNVTSELGLDKPLLLK